MRTRAGDFVLSADATAGDLSVSVTVTHNDGAPATIEWAPADTASLTSNVAANKTYSSAYSGPVKVQFDDFTSTGTVIDCTGPIGVSLDKVPKSCTSFKQVGYDVFMNGTSLPSGLTDVHVESLRSPADVDRCIQALEDNGASSGTLFLAEQGLAKDIDLLESRSWTVEIEPATVVDFGKSKAPHTTRLNGKTVHHADRLRRGDRRPRRSGKNLNLNGTTEYGETPSAHQPATDKITMCAWIKTSSAADQAIISKYSTASNNRSVLVRVFSGGRIHFYVSSTGLFNDNDVLQIQSVATALNDGEWHHVAVTFDSGTSNMFIDGEEAAFTVETPGNLVTSINAAAEPWRIGAFDNTGLTNYFNGEIADPRVYVEVLSDSQIKSIAKMHPGSINGLRGLPKPALWYDFEESTGDPICKNKGFIKDADLDLTGTFANMRTNSDRMSFADELGASSCFVTDGTNAEYIDTQVTLNGATAFTVWRRCRYLSTSGFDVDGFQNSGGPKVELGRGDGTEAVRYSYGGAFTYSSGSIPIPTGELHTAAITSDASSNFEVSKDGIVLLSGATTGFTSITNTYAFYIGTIQSSGGASATQAGHTEYYEYLIAKRVLTDNELVWLNTGGEYGTAIDFLNDPDILLYYDFEDIQDSLIVNKADPSLPGVIVGGEWGVAPASATDQRKDVYQEEYSYATAVYTAANTVGRLDMGSSLIPASSDFDFSLDFFLYATDATDSHQTVLSQWTSNGTEGRILIAIIKSSMTLQFFVGSGSGNLDLQASGIEVGKWHTVRVTRVGDVFTLYLDDRLRSSSTKTVTLDVATNTYLSGVVGLSTHDEFHGLVSNTDFDGVKYLTTPDETVSGGTLTNASYVNVVRGKPGEMTWQGQNPLDPIVKTPCVTTNGTSDFLEAIFTVASSTTRSVAMWIKDAGANNVQGDRYFEAAQGTPYTRGIAIIWDDRDTTDGWGVLVGSSGANFTIYSFSGVLTTTSHVAVTVNGTDVKIYLNGVEVTPGTTTTGGTGFDGTLPQQTKVELGNGASDGHTFYGAADMFDCIMYSDVLTAEEIIDVMNGDYPEDNVLAHWHLSEDDGGIGIDRSGNNRHLILNGTVSSMREGTQTTSDIAITNGYSIGTQFNGNDSVNKSGRVTVGTITQLSGAAWICAETTASNATLASEYLYTTNNRSWNWRVTSAGDLEFTCSVDGTAITTVSSDPATNLVDGTFYHVAFVYDAGNVYWYIDGVLVDTDTTAPASLFDSAADFTIGNTLDTQFFDGIISHLVIEQGLWTGDEVAALKAAGSEKAIKAVRPMANVFMTAGSDDDTFTVVGEPWRVVIPAGTNLPPAAFGPGIPAPGQSRPLAYDANSAYALRYAGSLEMAYDDLYHEAVFPGDVWARVDLGSPLLPATADFDVSLEFNLTAVDDVDSWQTLFSQFSGNAASGRIWLRIDKADLNLELEFRDAPGNVQLASANSTVVVGKWHTARFTRVGDDYTLYLDGISVDSTTLAGQSVEQASNTFLGHGSSQLTSHDELNGRIRNVSVSANSTTTEYLNRQKGLPGATLTNVTVEQGAAVATQLFQRPDQTAVLYESAMSQEMADIIAAKKFYN